MNVPCFTLGSWYDFMNVGSIESYIGRQHHGGPQSRGTQHLLIGPWLHGSSYRHTGPVGDIVYPANSAFPVWEHMAKWFDHYSQGHRQWSGARACGPLLRHGCRGRRLKRTPAAISARGEGLAGSGPRDGLLFPRRLFRHGRCAFHREAEGTGDNNLQQRPSESCADFRARVSRRERCRSHEKHPMSAPSPTKL